MTVRQKIEEADRKTTPANSEKPVLSLAEQLKAAQSLLKPVNRSSLKEEKEKADEVKRASIMVNRTNQIS